MDNLNKCISEIWDDNYIVPLYQRGFSWQEQQIQQLLQDIYDNSKEPDSHYYVGSLVVIQRTDGLFEVIDGQQRLTTLHLICKSLGVLNTPHLSYDSRPEVEEFFADLFRSASSKMYLEKCRKKDCRRIYRLVEAIEIIEEAYIHTNPGKKDDSIISISSMTDAQKSSFGNYINNNVVLVRIVLPHDTDVAAYFEIMNNRGEQLQEHEIVKGLLLGKLHKEGNGIYSSICSRIWDACSQMDIPIQAALKEYRKDEKFPLFGDDYDDLCLNCLEHYHEQGQINDPLSIDDILKLKDSSVEEKNDINKDMVVNNKPIIDFPIFLMNVFKLINDDCQLNDNLLLATYNDLSTTINPMDFIKFMLKVRVLFDRYIIKSQGDEEDENIKWVMAKPYLYRLNNEKKLRFRNTFSKGTGEVSENENEENIPKRIKMQESMLQVTFRAKKYKNWLFDLLKWLLKENDINIAPEKISHYLDQWIEDYYNELERKSVSDKCPEYAFEALGTKTPHFVFNYIDYLYWVCHSTHYSIDYLNEVEDFSFKYYNSVEHHLPQSYMNMNNVNIVNNIANLCLISRRKNSSLSDKAPIEKAKIEPGLQPKRKIMYRMTIDDGVWGENQIEKHYRGLKELLDARKDILGLK